MALIFPDDCDNPRKRLAYCYRAQELLRRIHNVMGKWYREGLTQTQWDRLPAKLKNKYPYKAQLTQAEWDDFTNNIFEKISSRIINKLLHNRELVSQAETWQINVEDI